MDWKESRIFLGKNSVAQVALGRTTEEEYKDNLHLISQVKLLLSTLHFDNVLAVCVFLQRLEGNSGLLFTNRSKKEALRYSVQDIIFKLIVYLLSFYSLQLLFETAAAGICQGWYYSRRDSCA
jgi:hypothetical protein